MSKRYKTLSGVICAVAASAILLLVVCRDGRTELQSVQQSEANLSDVFQIQLTNGWRTVHAGAKESLIFRNGGWTEYYVIYRGSHEAFQEILKQLERRKGRPLLYDRFSANPHAKRPFSWWTPENEKAGYWVSFDTRTNDIHYFWEVYLVDKSTNALIYSQVFANKGAR